MEREIIWTATAVEDVRQIVLYLQNNWPEKVLESFYYRLQQKIKLLQLQPDIGFKSARHSRFRQTLISPHYKLIYSVKRNHIAILALKHTKSG